MPQNGIVLIRLEMQKKLLLSPLQQFVLISLIYSYPKNRSDAVFGF
jgi:hypothetical protein